jgi:hypothetical protein
MFEKKVAQPYRHFWFFMSFIDFVVVVILSIGVDKKEDIFFRSSLGFVC